VDAIMVIFAGFALYDISQRIDVILKRKYRTVYLDVEETMKTEPKMLRVETGCLTEYRSRFSTEEFIDYHVYEKIPKWWRWIEQILRMDIYLAMRVKKIANRYDIIWANSEKVAIPLSFLSLRKPLVVILQHPESPLRVFLLKLTGIAKQWAGIGIVSHESRIFLEKELGVESKRIFQYYSARLDRFKLDPGFQDVDGPIMSIGVAKRDYKTLIAALSSFPGYRSEIFVSSKYGDKYQGGKGRKIVDWISFPESITDDELVRRYQQARFVVIPLISTSHSGAGVTTAFEAGASGKAIIATRTGGMQAYVKDGETGILVPPYDVDAMRNAIRKLWENPDLAKQMGLAGRKYLEIQYNFETINPMITQFLIELWKTSEKNSS
jgi:glycosyltransferase involved in cell wall biosynthesis